MTKDELKKGLLTPINITLVICIAVILTIRLFICQIYVVPSASMETTIMTGEYILGNKLAYINEEPSVGDIVIFSDEEGSAFDTLVKRVIATEGQVVNLIDGVVYVDGKALSESYVTSSTYKLEGSSISFPYVVGEDELFVMGDNRGNSEDSRWFGAISIDQVEAKAFFVIFPFTDARTLS